MYWRHLAEGRVQSCECSDEYAGFIKFDVVTCWATIIVSRATVLYTVCWNRSQINPPRRRVRKLNSHYWFNCSTLPWTKWRNGGTGQKEACRAQNCCGLLPRSTALLEKLVVPHLVKKFPAFYGTRCFITVFITAPTCPYPEPHQSSPRPLYPITCRHILILSCSYVVEAHHSSW